MKPFFILLLFLAALTAAGQQDKANPAKAFADQIVKSRHAVDVQNSKLTDEGASVLQEAVNGAQFVLLGEDHGISQIPSFASGLFDLLAPQGFNTLALEIGSEVASQLAPMVSSADGKTQFVRFETQYPFSVAFYDWNEEFDFLQHSAKDAPGGFKLWGVDQELMGSSGLLLQDALKANPGPETRQVLEQMVAENTRDYANAAKSGNPGELFMMAVKDADLARLQAAAAKDGGPRAQHLIQTLMTSREIYQKNMSHQNYESNRQRAKLMKANFVDYFLPSTQDGKPPKIMFKFGAFHMYRGLNPMHSSELGNLISEFSEAHNFKMVNMLVLGVKGSQLHFAGIGRPPEAAPLDLENDKDSEYRFLKPFFGAMLPHGFTLYDLRGFRPKFSSYGDLDKEMERLIFGYDFLVLIPKPTPSSAIAAQ